MAASSEAWLDGLFSDLSEFDGVNSGHSSGTEDGASSSDETCNAMPLPMFSDLAPLPTLNPLEGLEDLDLPAMPGTLADTDELLSLLENGCTKSENPTAKRRGGAPVSTPRAPKRRSPASFSSSDSVSSSSSSSFTHTATSASPIWIPGAPSFSSGRRSSSAGCAASSSDPVEDRRLKKEHKKARNRQLAAESRERRKNRMDDMERENRELRVRVRDLEAEVRVLRAGQHSQQEQQQQNSLRDSDLEEADDDASSSSALETRAPASGRAHSGGAIYTSTKLGTAAMALAMSLVVVTDSSGGLRGGVAGGAQPAAQGSFELIGIWALAFDLMSGSGVALDLILPHVVALAFGTTLTFALAAAYYFQVMRAEAAPMLGGFSMSLAHARPTLRWLKSSADALCLPGWSPNKNSMA